MLNSTQVILQATQMPAGFSRHDMFALFVSAIIHDFQHPVRALLLPRPRCVCVCVSLRLRTLLRPALRSLRTRHVQGVSNAFLIKSNAKLAITYSDSSVLERHHVAAAFMLTRCVARDGTALWRRTALTLGRCLSGSDRRAIFSGT